MACSFFYIPVTAGIARCTADRTLNNTSSWHVRRSQPLLATSGMGGGLTARAGGKRSRASSALAKAVSRHTAGQVCRPCLPLFGLCVLIKCSWPQMSSVHAKPLFFLWSVPDKALGCISEECRFGNGKLWSVTEILDQKTNSVFLTNHGNV